MAKCAKCEKETLEICESCGKTILPKDRPPYWLKQKYIKDNEDNKFLCKHD